MLRALADLQNYKKRSLSEIDRARNAQLASIAFRLVPISDNLNRTLAAAEDGASLESLLEGVRIVSRQLKDALDELRVEKISPSAPFLIPRCMKLLQWSTTTCHRAP